MSHISHLKTKRVVFILFFSFRFFSTVHYFCNGRALLSLPPCCMYQSVDCINPTRLVCVCMIYNIMYGVGNILLLLFQNVHLKECLTMLHVHTSFTEMMVIHNIIGRSNHEFVCCWEINICFASLLVTTSPMYQLVCAQPVVLKSLGSSSRLI